jgi:4-hydroxythreonine-4-phosphate dehydrogenase/1,2-dihydroxy-3,5-cyclohexadiene-1,4-dicarboxylate dehydrogenase
VSARQPRRIALAVGDPNGIGPEISLRTVAAYRGRDELELALVGPRNALRQCADALGLGDALRSVRLHAIDDLPAADLRAGSIVASAGAAAVQAARTALSLARDGHYDAVVAAPHHETAIARAGIEFSGYPSLVARCCGLRADQVFLLLIGGGLRIVHATLHESVAQALGRLSVELVVDAARAGAAALQAMGIACARVALMGIDPHAGEHGLFGDQDQRITEPAARLLRQSGLNVDGPAGADVLLAAREHDLYVAMLHDQGHIPIKLLSPRRATAVSVGAELLFSSVGHGSAMDIAGRGVASPQAMIDTVALLGAVDAPDAQVLHA